MIWLRHISHVLRRERRDLNVAVRAYLAAAGYKLAALTFAEEAGVAAAANPSSGSCPALPDLLRRDAEREAALVGAARARAEHELMAGELATARARVTELQARATLRLRSSNVALEQGLGCIATCGTGHQHQAALQARMRGAAAGPEPLIQPVS